MTMSPVSPPSRPHPHIACTTGVGREEEEEREVLGFLGMAQGANFPCSWSFHHIPQHSEGVTVNPTPQTRALRLRELR